MQHRAQLDLSRARRSLRKFSNLTQELKETRAQNEHARLYQENYLYRQAALTWFSHFKRTKDRYGKLKQFRRQNMRARKRKIMALWVKGSE